jgi:hypothetical protein
MAWRLDHPCRARRPGNQTVLIINCAVRGSPRRTQSRSPTGSTCRRTWPRRSSGASPGPEPGNPCENVRMDGLACPCGLGDDYASCCGRLHAGAPAPTAESLMRSRYSAFAVGDVGYLLRTWHPSSRPRTSWKHATGGSSTPPARSSSVPCTSSRGSAASSRKRAGSSGKTDSGPTSVPLTKRRLPSPCG